MSTAEASARAPASLRLAQLVRGLPDFPGRDTLLARLVRPALRRDAVIRGSFGGGLRFAGNAARDANVIELLLLRFARPALAPVLDAALAPGGVFADVGANHGLYTLWGARRVGAGGRVHAFEPLPDVRARLEQNLRLNAFTNVEVVAQAVGAEASRVTLHRVADGSGRTSRYLEHGSAALDTDVVTLDSHFASRRPPDLVKIDVEGMELQVLRGAAGLLAGAGAPIVVFEAGGPLLARAGTSYAELLGWLADAAGHRGFALTPRGLRLEPPGSEQPGSLNVLALRPDLAAHERVRAALAGFRFEANQNA